MKARGAAALFSQRQQSEQKTAGTARFYRNLGLTALYRQERKDHEV
jgi:hypothetical protein